MCSVRTCDYNNVYFIVSLCWLIPAFAVECTVLAQLQSKPDGDVDQLKSNHFFPCLFFFQISVPIQFRIWQHGELSTRCRECLRSIGTEY